MPQVARTQQRRHYELAFEELVARRVAVAFDELALEI
jgi:hypothetical protein